MSICSCWLTPTLSEFPRVLAAKATAAVISELLESGWMQLCPTGPYNEEMPFFYASFPGISDEASVRPGDPSFDVSITPDRVVRPTHCRSVTVMVTDTLLVAPTTAARKLNVPCQTCGRPLLEISGDPMRSRVVPDSCPSCGGHVSVASFRKLPAFRFAVILELWYPPRGRRAVVDPTLLALLERHAGQPLREDVQSVPRRDIAQAQLTRSAMANGSRGPRS